MLKQYQLLRELHAEIMSYHYMPIKRAKIKNIKVILPDAGSNVKKPVTHSLLVRILNDRAILGIT